MKKKLLIGAVAALFLGAGVFTATSLAAKEQISDLTLANIEAMTWRGNEDRPATCTFTKVEKNQEKNTLHCSGTGGTLCCTMD